MSRKNIPEDVWKRIYKRGENDCWEWMGGKIQHGYGKMAINNKPYLTHRIVYEQIHGSIPNGLDVLHTCNNPSCCNPNHLKCGTHADNMKQMITEGRRRRPMNSCKLKPADIIEIRTKYYSKKNTQYEIAIEYGVGRTTIGDIIRRKTWSHL